MKPLACSWMFVFFLLFPAIAWPGDSPSGPWRTLETKYTVIRYRTTEELTKFEGKVDYSPGSWGISRLFSGTPQQLEEKIGKKIDLLYERVQEILDMRKSMKKISVNLYGGRDALHQAYEQIFKTPCNFRAWYIYDFNTIYINVEDLDESMLAHEMAHSIIDHYLIVRPPAAAAEILARYVDKHLYD